MSVEAPRTVCSVNVYPVNLPWSRAQLGQSIHLEQSRRSAWDLKCVGERTEDTVVLAVRRVPLLLKRYISVIVNFIFKIWRYVQCFLSYHGYEVLMLCFLTPWSRLLLEKLKVPQPVNKFHAFYGTGSFITVFAKAHRLSWSKATWIQSVPIPFFCTIRFNIMLPY